MYNLKILDSKVLEDRTWLLCKGNLNEYLLSLKTNFYNFSIQRKIVKNQYLDTLITTVKQGDPIPLITLTYKDDNFDAGSAKEISLDMENVEILDGLQRTFRLWAHARLIEEFKNNNTLDVVPFVKHLKEINPDLFDTGVLSLGKIKALVSNGGMNSLEDSFSKFEVYFVVWVNLDQRQIIHKMLVLNAGQRSVTKTHQFELLFLYLWEGLRGKTGVRLFREKDKEASSVKSGDREVGDYVFSSIIVGLRSFFERKPLRVSTDDLDIDELYSEVNSDEVSEKIFNQKFIGQFLDKVKALDQIIKNIEPEEGLKWFVKDTTLSGMLAALGDYAGISVDMEIDEIERRTELSFKKLTDKLIGNVLDLEGFIEQYNILSSRSVNIGTFIRKVVMHYILELLNDRSSSWENSFNSNLKKN